MPTPMTALPLFSAAHLQRRDAFTKILFNREDHMHDLGREARDTCQMVEPPSPSHPPLRRKRRERHKVFMTVKPPAWITAWFVLTAPVIFWDAGFLFLRPRSFEGGDLHWIWSPYSIYQNVDLVYGVKAWENHDGFANAQSFMNVIETLMNIAYVYLAQAEWPGAPLLGFTAINLTLGKTIMYWMQEYYCGYCKIGHNSAKDVIVYWIIPNGAWLVVPSIIIYSMGKDIVQRLTVAESKSKKA